MIAITGMLLVTFRGICLDNGTCECPPLYTGESCGTFVGCPENLNPKICHDLIISNRMSTLNFTNEETNFKPPFNGNSGENIQIGDKGDNGGGDSGSGNNAHILGDNGKKRKMK